MTSPGCAAAISCSKVAMTSRLRREPRAVEVALLTLGHAREVGDLPGEVLPRQQRRLDAEVQQQRGRDRDRARREAPDVEADRLPRAEDEADRRVDLVERQRERHPLRAE